MDEVKAIYISETIMHLKETGTYRDSHEKMLQKQATNSRQKTHPEEQFQCNFVEITLQYGRCFANSQNTVKSSSRKNISWVVHLISVKYFNQKSLCQNDT